MRVGVIGAGAVGCYYGGMLSRAGHDVVLIGRALHVNAINANGLRLQTTTFDELVPVAASVEVSAVAGADMVLICVKSADSESVGQQLEPQVGPDAMVLSLQNGLDNAARIASALGRPVLPVVVYVASAMEGPGHVHHRGNGELVLNDGPEGRRTREAFEPAGVPVRLVADVRSAQWAKLATNCAWNAVSAITDRPYGWLSQIDAIPAALADTVAECRAVAAAEGVELASSLTDDIIELAGTMSTQRSSTAQDLARGRPSEIDHLNGYVVRRGAELGIPTPANRVLYALVKALESKNELG